MGKQTSQFERTLVVQPWWFYSFISCFIHRYWKWIETKRYYLQNECVKGCVFMCFPSHSSCFVKLPPDRWLTCSMKWNQWTSQFVDRWNYFCFIVCSESWGNPAESFFVHKNELFSWDLLVDVHTNKILCFSRYTSELRKPWKCVCPFHIKVGVFGVQVAEVRNTDHSTFLFAA